MAGGGAGAAVDAITGALKKPVTVGTGGKVESGAAAEAEEAAGLLLP